MKIKFTYFFLMISLFSNVLKAQDFSHEFGSITKDEINLKEYEKDTTAEAILIYDSGESSFLRIGDNFDLVFKKQTKIKVLKESYINNAQYYIPIYKGNTGDEKLSKIEAYTYNFNNDQISKTEVDKAHYYTETINEYWDQIKFAMPNVQAGSIIEFRYEVISPYMFLLNDWTFQNSIPTIHSEYTVKMIPFYEYQLSLQGAPDFDEKEVYEEKGLKNQYYNLSYSDKVYKFVMKDVPAFKDESFISSKNDYIIRLDFQLSKIHRYGGGSINVLSTWENLIKEMLGVENFGKYINKAENKFKKIIEEENSIYTKEVDKLNYVIDHIKKNYNWNGHYGKRSNSTINEFLNSKTGNSGDINLYLTGALRAIGIEASPVIISTRSNGKIVREYPFLDPFNYVLVYAKVNEKWGLYDATDIFCPNDKIPENCINDIGLIIRKGDVKWIKIQQNEISFIQTNYNSDFSINTDSVFCQTKIQATGYKALNLRKKYNDKTDEIEESMIKSPFELESDIKTENYTEVDKPYLIEYDFSTTTERIGNKIIMHPFFYDPIKDNPFKEKARTYPIDMIYPNANLYVSEIQIPESYKAESLPENYNFSSNLFLIHYDVKQEENKIIVTASYQFKKSIYPPEDYSRIKLYFDLIIEKFNQKIGFVKSVPE